MQSLRTIVCISFLIFNTKIILSNDTTSFTLSGYAELYWGFQQGGGSERPSFLYNHTQEGGALNVGWVKYTLNHNRWRMVAAPMVGSYVRRNMSAEPNAVRHIYEASLGYELGESGSRLDVGVLPSHIGLESNVGAEQINLTRGLLAENTPYYECGIRWSGENTNGLKWALLVLNGWQRIALDDARNWPAFGLQIQHVKSNGRVLNYSNYMGSINQRITTYHNLYGQWVLPLEMRLQAEANYESVPGEKDFLGVSIALGRAITKKWRAACRVEQTRDNRGLFFSTKEAPVNLNPGGYSVNVEYTPFDKLKCRLEARRLWSAKNELLDAPLVTSAMWLITASACISF